MPQDDYLLEIQKRLRYVIRKEKQSDGIKKLFLFIIYSCFVMLVSFSLESIYNFETGDRALLFFITLSIELLLLIIFVLYPFIKDYSNYIRPDYVKTAQKVGHYFPELKDDLGNALQLIKEHKAGYSSELINAALKHVYVKSLKYNFSEVISFAPIKRFFGYSAIITLMSIILLYFVPGLSSASYRLLYFNKSFSTPPKYIFTIQPGNKEITKGENVSVQIKTEGEQPESISLQIKFADQTDFSIIKLRPDSLGIFHYEAVSVKNSFEYYAAAEKIKSEVYKIFVVNRPIITNFEITVIPPIYSQLPELRQKDNGNISALPGSKIVLSLNSSHELANAKISFSDSTLKQMNVHFTKADAEFPISKNLDYQLRITDIQGNTNINPIIFNVRTLTDESPSIEMITPNKNVKLGKENSLPLEARIKDDYGFTKMNLWYKLVSSKYRKPDEEFTQIQIPVSKSIKEDDVYYIWDISPLVLAEGEVVSYYLEIFDNDNVSGPKSAKTQQFTLTIPSIDELYAEAETKQDNTIDNLKETLQDADKLKQELQKISDDLKQNSKEISWQEKESVEKAAEKFKEITKKIDDVSQKLSEMKNDLAKNNLLSEETLKKYNELQNLLEQMGTEEMKEALKRLQDSLKGLARDNVQMSMEEMKDNEEFIQKSIERTLNLLKRIQTEQKVDELVKRTEELLKKIDEIKDKTDKSNISDKSKRDELTSGQKDISKDLQNLRKEMDKLDDLMKNLKDLPNDQMEKIQKEFDKDNNEKISQDAENNIRQQQKPSATQNQQSLSQNIKKMKGQFNQLQNSMRQMNQMKTFNDLIKVFNDLIELSKDQEALKNETEKLGSFSQDFTKLSREQNELQNSLGNTLKNMNELSQKSFVITPEMGKALGNAYTQMQQSLTLMQNKNGSPAVQLQKEAMASLNDAASLLKGGMDQMMNGGEGGGMMSLMQQLQKLGQQQMSLNKLTQMLNQGKMNQETASQIQRLAQQQEMIRKSLEQMNKEARESGQSKRLAANLEKILGEMKEVVTNLQSQKVNDDLVKKQERILSKLLDAQTSMNERDYEKERKSNAGKDFDRSSPPDIVLDTDEGRNKLRDELMKAVKEGYKKDYEELIRKYFEALQNEKSKK